MSAFPSAASKSLSMVLHIEESARSFGSTPKGSSISSPSASKPKNVKETIPTTKWCHETYGIDQAEGEQKTVEIGGPVQQQVVGKWYRRVLDALAPGEHGGKRGKVRVHAGGKVVADLLFFMTAAQIVAHALEQKIRLAVSELHSLDLVPVRYSRNSSEAVGISQVMAQGVGERYQPVNHAVSGIAAVTGGPIP